MTTSTAASAKPRKQPSLRFKSGEDAREMRKKLGMNQAEFWSKLSVTQSGGSRYESGRSIPGPVRLLLHMTYGTEKQATDLLSWLRDKE